MVSQTDFDAFIEMAWNDHADQPEVVAERLQQSLASIEEPQRIAPYARLVTHVFGEHLARWNDGITLLESIRHCSGWHDIPADHDTLKRNVAALHYAAGNPAALAGLAAEDRVTALAIATSALMGQNDYAGAINSFEQAVQQADPGWAASSPAFRALAVGGNNLACGLEEKNDRDEIQSQGMVSAATAALKYWTLAGTWLQQERAEYRLTRSLLKAGRSVEAVAHAQQCIAICAANGAAPFEHFFGHAALAMAQRANHETALFQASRVQALHFYAQVPADEQVWCATDLTALED
jgi:tetratricopeptide (TPR) repeat protein